MNTKLIIIEGIPGSGKTTMAKNVYQFLQDQLIPACLFTEGNPKHPADFEGIACLSEIEYENMLVKYNDYKTIIETFTLKRNGDYFVSYYEGTRTKNKLPDNLFQELQEFDVYQLPNKKFCELLLDRWTTFTNKALESNEVTVFECCFLQNPMNILLARDNSSREQITDFLTTLSETIKILNPVLVYNYQQDVGETLERVIRTRSKEWFDFFTWYFTEQAYGKANRLEGKSGVISFLKQRKAFEMEILKELSIDTLFLNNSNYDFQEKNDEVRNYLLRYF